MAVVGAIGVDSVVVSTIVSTSVITGMMSTGVMSPVTMSALQGMASCGAEHRTPSSFAGEYSIVQVALANNVV